MSSILPFFLLAATATAQLTTSIRLPVGGGDSTDYEYAGSVIAVDGDKTTLAVELSYTYDDMGEVSFEAATETITLGGSTWMETFYTTVMEDNLDFTYSFACDMPANTRKDVTCTYSQNGAWPVSMICGDYEGLEAETETRLYTYTSDELGPASVETVIYTYGLDEDDAPSFCTESATRLPESLASETVEMSGTNAPYVDIVITAGQEKLGATAGASPTTTGPRPTGTGLETSVTAAQNGSPTGNVPAAPENTGNAAPMITMAPALAMGAAMAAFVL